MRDLPRPGSPQTRTTWPSPALARAQRRTSTSTSSSRPTSRLSAAPPNASNPLSTALGRRTPPLGIVLMRSRVAKIGEHPVTHVLGYKAIEPGDDPGDGAVIHADDFVQILGIEPCRELGRADQIAEHHRQLPALCGGGDLV